MNIRILTLTQSTAFFIALLGFTTICTGQALVSNNQGASGLHKVDETGVLLAFCVGQPACAVTSHGFMQTRIGLPVLRPSIGLAGRPTAPDTINFGFIEVHPSPVHTFFKIVLTAWYTGPADLTIYSLGGLPVYSKTVEFDLGQSVEILLNCAEIGISNGAYLITVGCDVKERNQEQGNLTKFGLFLVAK